jgi:CPA1 family monovalent cation:H+ antiporter
LALPDNIAERSQITIVAFGVVAFSIFAQGLTVETLMTKLGLREPSATPKK